MSSQVNPGETENERSSSSVRLSKRAVVRPIQVILRTEELGILMALLFMAFLLSVSTRYFFTPSNIFQIGRQVAYIGILATGMCFVMASGQIDISVGSIVTLSSWAIPTGMMKGVNAWVATLLGLGTGALCGLVNGGLVILAKLVRRLRLIDNASETRRVCEYVRRLNIITDSVDKRVIDLSGGNQQKVVVAKWLAAEPKVLILNDPTRGIDLGAKAEIYALIARLAKQALAILFTSSELDEILGVSDRL